MWDISGHATICNVNVCVLEASTQKDMYEISVSFIKLVKSCMVKIRLVAETQCQTAPGKFYRKSGMSKEYF